MNRYEGKHLNLSEDSDVESNISCADEYLDMEKGKIGSKSCDTKRNLLTSQPTDRNVETDRNVDYNFMPSASTTGND